MAGSLRALAAAVALAALSVAATGPAPIEAGAAVPLSGALLLCAARASRGAARAGVGVRRIFFIGEAGQLSELVRESGACGGVHVVDSLRLKGALADAEVEALPARVIDSGVQTLVVSDGAIRDDRVVAAAAQLNVAGVQIRDLRAFYEQKFGKVAVSELSPSWFLFDIAEIHQHRRYGRAKRAGEIAVVGTLVVATLPLMLVAAAAVKLSSPGPVLYRQRRVGRGGHPFVLVKLRTMHVSGETGATWASACAARIFPVGRLLRKFRIDELPQLWNVIRGDLSLVGPRPEQPEIVDRLERSMRFYAARHAVRPGLTGWAQVNGGYLGSEEGALRKLQYDLFYIKRQSLTLDLRIVASTVRTVLRGTG